MLRFDAPSLLREYGDEGLVRDLARLLVETLPPQIDAVTAAVATGNGTALRAAAHKLRGSIATFGADAAVELTRELEAMATAGDLSQAARVSNALAADVQSLRESARAWLAGAGLP